MVSRRHCKHCLLQLNAEPNEPKSDLIIIARDVPRPLREPSSDKTHVIYGNLASILQTACPAVHCANGKYTNDMKIPPNKKTFELLVYIWP